MRSSGSQDPAAANSIDANSRPSFSLARREPPDLGSRSFWISLMVFVAGERLFALRN